ncbi:MAG: nucleotidyltransferase domain-containing protein [Nitrospinae bacterium]|nr:nucleotidyltransferase domain-containing protein [Nitrospinota bacterium]
MKLTLKEKEVIEEFKKRVKDKFGGEIIKIIVFGSSARGDAGEDSDIDILVITSSDDWRMGDEIRGIGYNLDAHINYRLSIQVIPESHINYLRENSFQFIKNIESEGAVI